jgi:hypothetical protein
VTAGDIAVRVILVAAVGRFLVGVLKPDAKTDGRMRGGAERRKRANVLHLALLGWPFVVGGYWLAEQPGQSLWIAPTFLLVAGSASLLSYLAALRATTPARLLNDLQRARLGDAPLEPQGETVDDDPDGVSHEAGTGARGDNVVDLRRPDRLH